MNSVWDKVYDPVKDRRYGMLFFTAVVGLFCIYIVGAWGYSVCANFDLDKSEIKISLRFAAPGIFLLGGALVWREIHRDHTQQKKRFERREMSRDEILKARSKLMKAKTK